MTTNKKEFKETMCEASNELRIISNRLACFSGMVGPKDPDYEIAFDFQESSGFAEMLQGCANKISAVIEKIEPYKKADA